MAPPQDLHRDPVDSLIKKIKQAVAGLQPLYPLDTRGKIEKAIPHWDDLYRIIGFTTVDVDTEQRLLRHPDVVALVPETRRAVRECEAAFETAFAEDIAAAPDAATARRSLAVFPIRAFYEHTFETEWTAATTVLGRAPRSVAILGSGPLPATCIWILDWARDRGRTVHVHNVDVVPERLETGRRAVARLFGLDKGESESQGNGQSQSRGGVTSSEAGDARTTPRDLSGFDAVYFNATVGSTTEEKEAVLLEVAARMRPGAVMVSRGSNSLKSLFYPPTVMNSPRLMQRLRPVLACHMNGEPGRSINASVVVSRVLGDTARL